MEKLAVIVFEKDGKLDFRSVGVYLPESSLPLAVVTGDNFQVVGTRTHSVEDVTAFIEQNFSYKSSKTLAKEIGDFNALMTELPEDENLPSGFVDIEE